MKATAFEFRFRMWLIVLLIALGFWSPWIEVLGWGTRTTAWLWLGFQAGGLGIRSTSGIVLVTWLALLLAALGAALRVWGTAYLGAGVVFNRDLKAGQVLADGPYRFVRNPLYIGSWFTIAAISALMPPSGAAMVLALLALFVFRLILSEEAFLAAKLGEPYQNYLRSVPRLIPMLRTRVPAARQRPQWGRALLAECFPVGSLVSFAALSWQYNAYLLERAMLVCFGISLVARALIAPKAEPAQPAA